MQMHGHQLLSPPISPREFWISNGRQLLHVKPLRCDRWSEALEVNLGQVMYAPPAEIRPPARRPAASMGELEIPPCF
jgi:hypothetical protein